MVLYDNSHKPTTESRQRVSDLAVAGIPKHLIAKIIKIDDETLTKHYEYELLAAQPIAVERISKTVYQQALEGDVKSQSLYLKTQGSKFGWIERQVVETVSSDETQALHDKIKELEGKFERDY